MPNRLMRVRLNERLARAARFPVTLIVAPAGFGKTVALQDFLETSRLEAIRYDVRREHDSLLAFVRGLAEALSPAAPSAAPAYPSLGTRVMAADDPVRECSDWLAEHLKRTVCTVVIDDVHHAAIDPLAVAFLVDLIERTRDRITWILATRSDVGLPVASWVGYGIMDVPIGESDLRFTKEETLAVADDSGATTDIREIEALRELTGGWPVALAIALRTRTQAADLGTATAGTREMIYRYLAEQVFARLPPEQRRLLVDTCVFGAFDAGVAEALGATPELFAELRRNVAFMSATSSNEYRYHDLFRDFLESQLRGSSEREWQRVVRNAAAILETRGNDGESLRLLVKIADAAAIVRVLERAGFDLIDRGETEALADALEVVPQESRAKNAVVLGIAAMLDAARGHFAVSEGKFLSAIGAASDPTVRWTLLYRYALELVRNQRDCIEILGPLAIDDTMPKELQVPVLATLATAYAVAGRLDEAFATMESALKALGIVTRNDVRARVYQQAAYVFQFQASYERAKDYAQLAVEQAIANNLFEVAARAYSVLYNIVYEETNDPIAVLAVLDKLGEAARKAASNQVRLFGLIAAYEIEAERGDEPALLELDRQLAGVSMTLPRARAESLIPAQALRMAWSGDFAGAWRSIDGTAAHQSTPERRALRAADTALYALAAGQQDQSEAAMQEAREALVLCDRPTRRTARTRLMLGLVELLRGHSNAAHHHLSQVERSLTSSMHRLRTFAQCVRTLYGIHLGQAEESALLAGLERMRSEHMGGMARLIEALPRPQAAGGVYASLTPTERRVLALLVKGASTKEVAAQTLRSPQTVDTHIRSICRKLQCSGRRAAVAMAVTSGWSAT